MDSGLESMSIEQMKEVIRIQADQAKESEDKIAWYKRAIDDFEKKVRTIEQEKESILKEKESIQKEKDSILKKFQEMLEKFS